MSSHAVRIVGGRLRRSRLPVPDLPGLRPTPDRVRETLFNWLRHFWGDDWSERRVLDLFAGTGALGFEAASQGAGYVQMVESHPVAIRNLRTQRDRLQTDAVRVHAGDAMQVLARLDGTRPFDLVLLDPPFGQGWLERVWPSLSPLLTPDSLVYVEAEQAPPLPAFLSALRTAHAGRSHFTLARLQDNAAVQAVQDAD